MQFSEGNFLKIFENSLGSGGSVPGTPQGRPPYKPSLGGPRFPPPPPKKFLRALMVFTLVFLDVTLLFPFSREITASMFFLFNYFPSDKWVCFVLVKLLRLLRLASSSLTRRDIWKSGILQLIDTTKKHFFKISEKRWFDIKSFSADFF